MGLELKPSALILSGGKSSRYGSAKALIEISGQPLISNWFSFFNSMGTCKTAVVFSHDLENKIKNESVIWIEQESPELPQFASLLRGLQKLNNDSLLKDGVWVTPVDVLPPSHETGDKLTKALQSQPPKVALRPHHVLKNLRGHPVFLSADFCIKVLKMNPMTTRLDNLLKQNEKFVVDVPVDDDNILSNINIPER